MVRFPWGGMHSFTRTISDSRCFLPPMSPASASAACADAAGPVVRNVIATAASSDRSFPIGGFESAQTSGSPVGVSLKAPQSSSVTGDALDSVEKRDASCGGREPNDAAREGSLRMQSILDDPTLVATFRVPVTCADGSVGFEKFRCRQVYLQPRPNSSGSGSLPFSYLRPSKNEFFVCRTSGGFVEEGWGNTLRCFPIKPVGDLFGSGRDPETYTAACILPAAAAVSGDQQHLVQQVGEQPLPPDGLSSSMDGDEGASVKARTRKRKTNSGQSKTATAVEAGPSSKESHGSSAFGVVTCSPCSSRKCRTIFSDSQGSKLREAFKETPYIDREERMKLAKELGINQEAISVWFKNQRSKEKKRKMLYQD